MNTPQLASELANKISSRSARIGIIGLGYVGLPLISAFTNAGFKCLGFDVDDSKIQQLRQGKSYIRHIQSETIADWIRRGVLDPTSDMSRLHEADALLICVPTPLNESRDPDLQYIESTGHAISKVLRLGQLIILESTTYPTTTRDVLVPILNQNPAGLQCGRDFFVAFSPEREDPGNPNFTAAGIPKVVGGTDQFSGDLAADLYSHAIVKVVQVDNAEIAEACKILENTYRAVNIALVNELKMLFDRMGIDIWKVVDAAKTKPFGFQAFYLSWLARRYGMSTRFIELAGEVNTFMPRYVVSRVADFLNDAGKPVRGSRICILGMAYKKDVDDPRESPSFELLELLLHRGAILSYSDPHVPSLPKMRHYHLPHMQSTPLSPDFLAQQDCVLISTDHSAFDYEFIAQHSPLIVDTRNATRSTSPQFQHKIFRA